MGHNFYTYLGGPNSRRPIGFGYLGLMVVTSLLFVAKHVRCITTDSSGCMNVWHTTQFTKQHPANRMPPSFRTEISGVSLMHSKCYLLSWKTKLQAAESLKVLQHLESLFIFDRLINL